MAFSSVVSAPQMDWEAPDIVLTFARFRQKCELMFSSVLKQATVAQMKIEQVISSCGSGEKRTRQIQ